MMFRFHKKKTPTRLKRPAGPYLLAVNAIVTTLKNCTCFKACKVGAGAGLGESLAPDVLPSTNRRQEFVFLLLRAKFVNDRPRHMRADPMELRCIGLIQLIGKNVHLHRCPTGAPIGR